MLNNFFFFLKKAYISEARQRCNRFVLYIWCVTNREVVQWSRLGWHWNGHRSFHKDKRFRIYFLFFGREMKTFKSDTLESGAWNWAALCEFNENLNTKIIVEKKVANNSKLSIMFYFPFLIRVFLLLANSEQRETWEWDGVNVQKQKSNKSIKWFMLLSCSSQEHWIWSKNGESKREKATKERSWIHSNALSNFNQSAPNRFRLKWIVEAS